MKYPAQANQARISEIFSSIQGEGTHVGERHLFIRFEECHIHCKYCDELDKVGVWKTLDEVIKDVQRLEDEFGPHNFISFTGGEPLLYLPFLKSLMPRLKSLGFKLYLETDGILFQALPEVLSWVDCIAMDMKTPSVTSEKNFDEAHARFLALCQGVETFVKIVVSRQIELEELENEVRIIQKIAPETPLVLMPLSSNVEGHEDPELMALMEKLQIRFQAWIPDVRLGIRIHKLLNIR